MQEIHYLIFLVKGARVFKPMRLPGADWGFVVRMAQIAVRGRKCDFGMVVREGTTRVIGLIGAREEAGSSSLDEILANHAEVYPKFVDAMATAVGQGYVR